MRTDGSTDQDEPGLRLLAGFRADLQGAPADAKDRMRHAVLNGTRHGRSRDRGRRAWILPVSRRVLLNSAAALALTGLIGGVVVAAGVLAQRDPRSANHVATRDVAYIKTQTLSALAKSMDYVMHAHETYAGGASGDMWVDARTQRTRYDEYAADGSAVQSTTAVRQHGKESALTVDYQRRTWWASTAPDPGGTSPGSPDPANDEPANLRDSLSQGTLQLLGEERVDGHDTLHLRLTPKAAFFAMDVWVDKTTFLPYQRTLDKSGQMTATPTQTDVYAWLPRTPANLVRLDLTVPARFTRRR